MGKGPGSTSFFKDFARARIQVYLIVWPLFIAAMTMGLGYSCNSSGTKCFACGFRGAFKLLVRGHVANAFAESPLLGPVLASVALSVADVAMLLTLFLLRRNRKDREKAIE